MVRFKDLGVRMKTLTGFGVLLAIFLVAIGKILFQAVELRVSTDESTVEQANQTASELARVSVNLKGIVSKFRL